MRRNARQKSTPYSHKLFIAFVCQRGLIYSVGKDLREGKVTLPLVYALEQAFGEERRRVETILRDRNYDRVPFSQILTMVERYQGIARVKERAQAFTEKARAIIGEFPDSPYQRALYSVTELVTERDH